MGNRTFRRVALRGGAVAAMIMTAVVALTVQANAGCNFSGNGMFLYTFDGVNGEIGGHVTASGTSVGTSESTGLDSVGPGWTYMDILVPYEETSSGYKLTIRPGVFLTLKKEYNLTLVPNEWAVFDNYVAMDCNLDVWGPSKYINSFRHGSLEFSDSSAITGVTTFDLPIARVSSVIASDPPSGKPSFTTGTIWLKGSIRAATSCTVNPERLDVDLGTFSASSGGKSVSRTINVVCKQPVSGQVFLGGKPARVGDRVTVESNDPNADFFIQVKRNDFLTSASSGTIGLDVGMAVTPHVTPGNYHGATYLDLRFD